MQKVPFRPKSSITNSFNDGLIKICEVKNISKPGYKPVAKLVKKVALRYEEKRVGIHRFYNAKQNQVKLEKIVRVPRINDISNQDIVIDKNDKQYRIEQIQAVENSYPPALDISLIRVEQEYEV